MPDLMHELFYRLLSFYPANVVLFCTVQFFMQFWSQDCSKHIIVNFKILKNDEKNDCRFNILQAEVDGQNDGYCCVWKQGRPYKLNSGQDRFEEETSVCLLLDRRNQSRQSHCLQVVVLSNFGNLGKH